MKKITLLFAILFAVNMSAQDMVLTGVFDGPLPGGLPKAIEIYVINDIPDLSAYGVGSANNGGGTDGVELVFEGSATAGDYIWVASEAVEFENYFDVAPTFVGEVANINGDDAIELFGNVVDDGGGNITGDVIDILGDIDVDGSGEPWDHLDGWAYRIDDTGPDGSTFELDSWFFSGVDANDGETSNSTAANPWPIGTYTRTLSLGDNLETSFNLYPNPTRNGVVSIQTNTNQPIQVNVFDVLGKQVLSRTISDNRLNVSNLKSGIYLVQVTQNNSTSTKKLIVN
ncbi:T9SS type A sorting domain-containing protein [Planktosalinus lacus]|uniref:Secretion system C-terminal sorting domain-containing protein n=1 Tax=Planktosalinus lacus TaxID=1526573 RepID=A0A8J2Y941_9FLAO|nr:T9SS type A sorting domain-containing protein [Planktosalinus lacus]GGD90296.1 hypothetical protein GCM10011312_12760 [Planktosalinus lacus]